METWDKVLKLQKDRELSNIPFTTSHEGRNFKGLHPQWKSESEKYYPAAY